MTAIVGKAGKRLFEKHLEQYAPADPLYEYYTNAKGKKKRRKRELPQGLSARDAKILQSIKRRAHYLDKGFSILGLRFGWTFLIGLIPMVGDVADASLNYLLVVRKARQADLPPWLVRRMLMNNAVSVAVGFVPLVGDVVLAVYKANSRNAALLEEFLRIRGEEYLRIKREGEEAVVEGSGATGEKKTKRRGKGVSESDAAQIKPGAGKVNGEVIPVEDIAPPAATSSEFPVSGNGSDASSTPAGKQQSTTASRKSSSSTRKSFNFFSSKKAPPLPAGEKGRFVEDVTPAPGEGSAAEGRKEL